MKPQTRIETSSLISWVRQHGGGGLMRVIVLRMECSWNHVYFGSRAK